MSKAPTTWSWNYCLTGVTLLFLASFMDNVRGPLIPLLGQEFGISYAQSSYLFVLGHAAAVVSAFFLVNSVKTYAPEKIRLLCWSLALLVTVLIWFCHNLPSLYVFATLIGGCVSIMGSMSNIFVQLGTPLDARSKSLAGLHSVYGLASFLAPMAVALVVQQAVPWRFLFLPISVLALVGMIVGWRSGLNAPAVKAVAESAPLPAAPVTPRQRRLELVTQGVAITMFCLYVVGEVLSSSWMTAFLVDVHHLSVADASEYMAYFFIAMLVSRFFCLAVPLGRRQQKMVVVISMVFAASALFLGHSTGKPWFFSLIGVLGPYFPLMMAGVSRAFPLSWKALTIVILGSVQAILGLAHAFIGQIASLVGMQEAFFIPGIFIILAIFATLLFWFCEARLIRLRLMEAGSPAEKNMG